MPVYEKAYEQIKTDLGSHRVTLVAVSKTKPAEEIKQLYDLGQRDFGENYVQELLQKHRQLPADIRWHFIGHLQSNKVNQIAPFIHLIQSVDSFRLLQEINKQATKNGRVIDCLLQVHIAREETKFGFDEAELTGLAQNRDVTDLRNIRIKGLMGMASFTDDMDKVRAEFKRLKFIFEELQKGSARFSILSMGMSSDYAVAMEEGSTMVRIGSLLFGVRNTG